jgi:type VI secretion system protein ImpL
MLPPVWTHLARLARRARGRRVGLHPVTVGAALVLAVAAVSMVGMLGSAFANAQALRRSHAVVQALHPGDDAAQLRALLALQQRIGRYEARLQHPASGLRGFGLDRDRATLDALWAQYATASRSALTTPVQRALEQSLAELGTLRADAVQDSEAQRRGYNRLKAYLMLTDPARVEAPFLAAQMVQAWPVVTTMPPGEWQDTAPRLARFFAEHLKAHPAWRIPAATARVTAARATLVNQIGLEKADDTLYRSILDQVRGKYADLSLPALLHGADAQGLFTTSVAVPGVYTRAAWDGMVADAIDKAASERRVEGDWVLAGVAMATPAHSDDAHAHDLTQRLTARYFADYAAAWQHMLNSLQWQPAGNLHAAIDQLTRLTDAQTSPLIALMTSVQLQAQAGRPTPALGDTLVRHAKGLFGRDDTVAGPVVGPLDASFGPLLALMGERGATAEDAGTAVAGQARSTLHGVSLQSYLTAATTMRLKLQHIGNSPDAQAMARSLAQAVFQGKLSDLAQVREQAALTAASLGAAWAGFGEALFARPLDGAWQTILQPAAASLNDLWRASIAAPFNRAFEGRYPFYETEADASFAELGRYVRPHNGVIPRFLTTELAGVLTQHGDQWVPNGLAPQTLAFDPAFLAALQHLSELGARLYAQGEAGYHLQVLPQPTPDVTRSELTIDQQRIVYFNQQETWTPIVWPGDGLNGHAALTWRTLDDHVREVFDAKGDWAFLRLLAKADVKALDSARYELAWTHPEAETLRYVLRAQVGAGPLDLLKLRGFILPERMFIVGNPADKPATLAPPPMPKEPAAP